LFHGQGDCPFGFTILRYTGMTQQNKSQDKQKGLFQTASLNGVYEYTIFPVNYQSSPSPPAVIGDPSSVIGHPSTINHQPI
jgi:hypothetical protein